VDIAASGAQVRALAAMGAEYAGQEEAGNGQLGHFLGDISAER